MASQDTTAFLEDYPACWHRQGAGGQGAGAGVQLEATSTPAPLCPLKVLSTRAGGATGSGLWPRSSLNGVRTGVTRKCCVASLDPA